MYKEDKVPVHENSKMEQLDQYRVKNTDEVLTSDANLKISNTQWSLRAGDRGPTMFEDFHFYKKQSHFNRERIPERVVHARGYGVHGFFECTKSLKEYTKAGFLQEVGSKVPVFVRFSTLIGNKGSKDTAQDIRGFAVKFYTEEGNYDSLGLSFPIFVVQDAMKFVDIVHAVKPNPVDEIPQATSAHDNFWDYITNNQESAHFVMWLMSGWGRTRSYRMMDGYPVNTFRFINADGKSTFVRFHFKAALGHHSLLLDEAAIIGGVDPDFHRRDIKEAIEQGAYPEYHFGVQLIAEEDEFKYDFDVLDDTKIWPEEVIPLQIVGKMTLNKNVDNYFAETEQSSFDPSNLVPGIAFSNDPVLQGRSFAYRDTDYHRLGTANIEEIPINRPINTPHLNQRDGYARQRIDVDKVHFNNNALAGNTPATVSFEEGGFTHCPTKVQGETTRKVPSEAFNDHFSQPRMFWNSMSPQEKEMILESFIYHVGFVESQEVRQAVVDMFVNVDKELATKLAENIAVNPPQGTHVNVTASSPAVSEATTVYSAYTQKVGILIADGFNGAEVNNVIDSFKQKGVFYEVISEQLGVLTGSDGAQLNVKRLFITTSPVLYDSLYVVGGTFKEQERFEMDVKHFVDMAYRHYKPIGVATTGQSMIQLPGNMAGVISASTSANFADEFVNAIAQQRFWDRTLK